MAAGGNGYSGIFSLKPDGVKLTLHKIFCVKFWLGSLTEFETLSQNFLAELEDFSMWNMECHSDVIPHVVFSGFCRYILVFYSLPVDAR